VARNPGIVAFSMQRGKARLRNGEVRRVFVLPHAAVWRGMPVARASEARPG